MQWPPARYAGEGEDDVRGVTRGIVSQIRVTARDTGARYLLRGGRKTVDESHLDHAYA